MTSVLSKVIGFAVGVGIGIGILGYYAGKKKCFKNQYMTGNDNLFIGRAMTPEEKAFFDNRKDVITIVSTGTDNLSICSDYRTPRDQEKNEHKNKPLIEQIIESLNKNKFLLDSYEKYTYDKIMPININSYDEFIAKIKMPCIMNFLDLELDNTAYIQSTILLLSVDQLSKFKFPCYIILIKKNNRSQFYTSVDSYCASDNLETINENYECSLNDLNETDDDLKVLHYSNTGNLTNFNSNNPTNFNSNNLTNLNNLDNYNIEKCHNSNEDTQTLNMSEQVLHVLQESKNKEQNALSVESKYSIKIETENQDISNAKIVKKLSIQNENTDLNLSFNEFENLKSDESDIDS